VSDARSPLPVRLYGRAVGALGTEGGRRATFTWDRDLVAGDITSRGARPDLIGAALSPPLVVGDAVVETAAADAADNFFGGLLPEGIWLQRLANEVGESADDVHGLLSHVGADLAGALEIGRAAPAEEPVRLDDAEIARLLATRSSYWVTGGGSSLTGFQRKIALTRRGDAWWLGKGTWPSTHILKPVDPDRRTAALCEDYTLRLARAIGISDFDTGVADFDGTPTLVVERYDRELGENGSIRRVHQEDFAQALDIDWRPGSNAKFEQYNAGSTLRRIAGLADSWRTLGSGRERPAVTLLRYTTFNLAVGNTDAHMKNHAIVRPESGPPRLAPLYDAAPIALDYDGRKSMALSIAGQTFQPDITRQHLVDEARSWNMRAALAEATIDETLRALARATRDERAPSEIARTVPGYIRHTAERLLDGERAGLPGTVPPGLRTDIGTPLDGAAHQGANS
jgi:serine/threonine-protein kinase HipA